uniref:Large ribosomal subunit protein bL9c n=1 Tax=Acrosorium ciliolatum TaxID=1550622 RepID=A0A1Z1M1X3_9FLOR|nr:ribosomal protein L9 [Acrosorium ciliolatum]ARW60079.1 ribosomal protein L9 [Acrosorium ciliolatum]
MKKKIKIILKKDHLNIGQKGKITNISPGYAFNYLIPNNIAEIATKNKIKHITMFKNIKNQEIKAYENTSKILQSNLEKIKKINIRKKVGKNNNIFGSINEKDITNKILKYIGISIDKKQIKVDNIKKIGIFNININILHNIQYSIQLNITPENI